MFWIIDLVLIAFTVLEIFLGYKRGFFLSLMRIVSVIAAFFLSIAFSPRLAVWLEQTQLMRGITDTISSAIASLSKDVLGSFNVEKLFQDMPESLSEILSRYGADTGVISKNVTGLTIATEEQIRALAERITSPVVSTICTIIAFITIFLISLLILTFLTWLLDHIFDLPVLKKANDILGAALGFIFAFMISWLISSALISITPALVSIAPDYFNEDWIEHTYIIRFFGSNGFAALLEWLKRAKDSLAFTADLK